MKNFIIVLVVIIIAVLGIYYFTRNKAVPVVPTGTATQTGGEMGATTTPQAEGATVSIGKSVQGRDIVAYNYGNLTNPVSHVLFIGGVHGGYSYNTVLLAYQAMNYFSATPTAIPANVEVTVIPTLNPDGLSKALVGVDVSTLGATDSSPFTSAQVSTSQTVLTASRFNANNVDLSRNFDCDWQATGVWQTKQVSGGAAPFSEPESVAIKNYVASHPLSAVVVWYSAAGGVYSSSCDGIQPSETATLTGDYAKASGYSAHETFDAYPTSGDIVNWFAKNNIPAISVLLTNHTDTEWTKNQKGIDAVVQQQVK